MPDKEYKIRIVTAADPSGINQVKSGTAELSHETNKSTAANEEHQKSLIHVESAARLQHKILEKITEQSPLMGEAVRAAVSPQAGLFYAVVMALELFKKVEEEAMRAAVERADAATDSFNDLAEKSGKLSTAALDSTETLKKEFTELANQQTNAKTRTESVTTAINAQKEAIGQILKAQEALALAEAKTDEDREQVKQRFGHATGQLEIDAQRQMLKARQSELDSAIGRSKPLESETESARAKVFGTDGQYRLSQQQNAQRDLQSSKDSLKQAQEDLEKILSRGLFGSLFGGSEEEAQAKLRHSQGQVAFNQERVDALEREVSSAKAKLDAAEKRELENATTIQALQNQIPQQQSQLRLKETTLTSTEAYGRATSAETQIGALQQHLTNSAAALDFSGFVSSLSGFTVNMAKWIQASQEIAAANNAVSAALTAVSRSSAAMGDKATRLLPGAQP